MTPSTPKSLRLHIGLFGRRNVGKSSLLNALTRQAVSIVSSVAGTTTDPVEKPMELLPLGPVLFIDTAGIDDAGALGEMRVARTRQVFDRTDLAVLVAEAGQWTAFEDQVLAELQARNTPTIVAINKIDQLASPGLTPTTCVPHHAERSEESPRSSEEPLRCAQGDGAAAAGRADVAAHHSERGEESLRGSAQTLRCAQGDGAAATGRAGPATRHSGRHEESPRGSEETLRCAQGDGAGATAAPASSPASFIDSLQARNVRAVAVSALAGRGLLELRQALLDAAPADLLNPPALVADLVGPGELAVLVVPLDKEAPRGRLILPQVQAIRDLLDGDALCMVVKERELRAALDRLKTPPRLIVTDSQAFLKVAGDTPPGVAMTSFSVLLSRARGDLLTQARGAAAIECLRAGDRVLIAEACTHHPIGEDIGRVKIPRWLTQYVGGRLDFTHVQGHDFPADPAALAAYRLVILCGGCMLNRREVLSRILRCQQAGVPVTNYGLAIAYSLGIFERALAPFPGVLEACRQPAPTTRTTAARHELICP